MVWIWPIDVCVAVTASIQYASPVALANEIGRASCRERGEGRGVGGSSRRRHTRLQGDWSSDVCSSDLVEVIAGVVVGQEGVAGKVLRADQELREQAGHRREHGLDLADRRLRRGHGFHPVRLAGGLGERDRKSVV